MCSDSAGLSKLSKTFPLVHVLKLVAEPKEIIYAYGAAIGGQPVGTWVADNTQMWYPDEIPVGLVIVQMLAAQREIVRRCKLQVGLGVGCSAGLPLYRIGSGLYGAVLDEMEDFTEEESHAGEVNLSPAAWGAAQAAGCPAGFVVAETRNGNLVLDVDACALPSGGKYMPVLPPPGASVHFPASFPPSFHDKLRALDASDEARVEELRAAHSGDRAVLLVRAFLAREQSHGLLLEKKLAIHDAYAAVLPAAAACGAAVHEVSYLVILSLPEPAAAVTLALRLGREICAMGFPCNVGACFGEVFAFHGADQVGSIIGSPINLASKLAEDTEDRGFIYFESSMADAAREACGAASVKPMKVKKSGVEIEALVTPIVQGDRRQSDTATLTAVPKADAGSKGSKTCRCTIV